MKWSYFPRNQRITDDLLKVIDVFNRNNNHINSSEHKLKSDEVLHSIANGLEEIGYSVEKSKRDEDKIKMPVLYGECGKPSLNFEADAFNPSNNIVIEVEAGRAVTNYQLQKE